MRYIISFILLFAFLTCANADQQFVFVGNAGNNADSNGRGAVSYSYSIGKYEVTNQDYAAFLNSAARSDNYGLFQTGMATDSRSAGITRMGSSGTYSYSLISGAENRPITFVSWYSAARYVNWLNNGANTTADTESGVYNLNGATWNGLLGPGQQAHGFTRSANATYWLPSIDEWHKAAYYDPTKNVSGGYWSYPNQNDSPFVNQAGNYAGYSTTDVGQYAESFYGTFDQLGNVFEMVGDNYWESYPFRALGGSWNRDAGYGYSGYTSWNASGGGGSNEVGFRIASSIPEPSSLSLLALGGLMAALGRRRRS
jgi:formylglycine-generating enzyme required for sulfatase activity